MANSEQHVDARPSRISRDESDMKKLLVWFSSHPPFPTVNNIISIATGIVGDNRVNCYKSNEIGLIEMKKMIGRTYGSVMLKRSSRVLPLGIMKSSVKIRDELIPIDPLLLFQKISIKLWFPRKAVPLSSGRNIALGNVTHTFSINNLGVGFLEYVEYYRNVK